jgi:hypothetical protein
MQEEREQELLDVEREIANVRQEQCGNVCEAVPPNEASLDKSTKNYQSSQNAQMDVEVDHPELPVKHPKQDNVNQCPQSLLDSSRPMADQIGFPDHAENGANQPPLDLGLSPVSVQRTTQMPDNVDAGTALINVLKQVMTTPKLEYMYFEGNPIKYPLKHVLRRTVVMKSPSCNC